MKFFAVFAAAAALFWVSAAEACCSYGCCDCSCVALKLSKRAKALDKQLGATGKGGATKITIEVSDNPQISRAPFACQPTSNGAVCTRQ